MFNCTIHNWQNLFNQCPACQVLTTATESGGAVPMNFTAMLFSYDECQAKHEALEKKLAIAIDEAAKLRGLAGEMRDILVTKYTNSISPTGTSSDAHIDSVLEKYDAMSASEGGE